jgi:hypothetical protein
VSDKFTVKDSGKRRAYKSGMVRDVSEGKVQYHRLFHGILVERICAHLTKGAVKYPDNENGTPNWMNANSQAELNRFRESAARHFAQWMRGDVDEDHFSACLFNMNAFEWLRGKLEKKHGPR